MAKRAKGRLRKETVLGTVSMLRIGGLHQRMSLGKAVEWLDASMSVGTNSVLEHLWHVDPRPCQCHCVPRAASAALAIVSMVS